MLSDLPSFSDSVASFRQGSESPRDYLEQCLASIDSLRGRVDGFITLAAAAPAPIGLQHTGDRSFQIFWTLTGTPSFSLPRLTSAGLPVGLQVMGFRNCDAALAGIVRWIDNTLKA